MAQIDTQAQTKTEDVATPKTTGQLTYRVSDGKLILELSDRIDNALYKELTSRSGGGFRWVRYAEHFEAGGYGWCELWARKHFDIQEPTLIDTEERDESGRVARFEELAGRRAADAATASKQAHAIIDNIPMGQPILVGHHSERRHRRDLDRASNALGKSVENDGKAKYWAGRAKGAQFEIDRRSEPGFIARRVKEVQAEVQAATKRYSEWKSKGHSDEKLRSMGLTRDYAKLTLDYWAAAYAAHAPAVDGAPATVENAVQASQVQPGTIAKYRGRWVWVVKRNKVTISCRELVMPQFPYNCQPERFEVVKQEDVPADVVTRFAELRTQYKF